MRRTGTVITGIFLAVVLAHPALGATAPYDDASTVVDQEASGSGTAEASAAADENTGDLAVEADASEDHILPIDLLGGMSRAYAGAGVGQVFDITEAGDYTITATLTGVDASAASTDSHLGPLAVTRGDGTATASLEALFYDCTGEECTTTAFGGALGYDTIWLACSTACDPESGTVVLTGHITVPDGQSGHVAVSVGIAALAVARGQSEAAASAVATVSSIEVVPA